MSELPVSSLPEDSGASITIQLKPSYVVLGEVQNVIAAMRLNTRWSSRRAQKGKESPLLVNLLKLRKKLETEPDAFPSTEIIEILKPFLDVIKSDKTTGPITGVALSSVYKFLQYGFLALDRSGAIGAIEEIGVAVTNCRFEGTDPETDEVVLTKILNVLRKAVQVDAGALLSDQLLYEMVQTCFKMSIQMHLSVLLRKSAELALMEIVQHVFGLYGTQRKHLIEQAAVKILTISGAPMRSPAAEAAQSDSPSLSRAGAVSQTTSADGSVISSLDPPQETAFVNPAGVRFDADDDLLSKSVGSLSGLRPYGLPVLVKLFRFFCSIINPNYANNTDTMRFLGLALVNSVLEIASATVENTPKLLELVRDDLAKFLLQSLGSTDNVSIMTVSLRVAFNLFISLRHKLKFQMELFFNYIFRLFQHVVDDSTDAKPSADSNDTTNTAETDPLPAPAAAPATRGESNFPYEHLEIALETIVQLCADPNFLVDMYINYDCDLNSNNLFAHLADFLFKTSFPHNGQLLSINLLALDGLLAILYSVENRFKRPSSLTKSVSGSGVTAEQLKDRKHQKNLLLAAANQFNRKPKDGIKFLLEKKILPSTAEPRDFAIFFKNNKWINKTKLGEFFGEPDEFNVNCLREFIGLTVYSGRKFVDIVREFLQSFRIPGEAQKIERIMDLFSKDYFEREQGPCKTLDASYLLCFSIVMLNTELYNPNVQAHRKMTMEGYLKNLKGTNGGSDFPPELLSENYNSIKDNEIKIPEEQVNERHISNSTWRYLLTLSEQQVAGIVSNVDSGVYDKFLFSLTWKQIHSAVRSVFSASNDSELNEQMLEALALSGEICAHFSLHHAFDNLVNILGDLSTLVTSPGATPYAEKLRYVQFSRNKRAQLATVALFDLARTCPTQMREGWKTILSVLFNVSPLLKLPILDREDLFNFPKSVLLDQPPREKQESAPSPILGIMTSFWPFSGSSSSTPAEIDDDTYSSDDEPDTDPSLSTENETPRDRLRRMIVHDCKLAELLKRTSEVDIGSLDHLIKNLVSAASPKWAKPAKDAKHMHKPSNRELNHAVFALDVLVDVVVSNSHRQKQVWVHVHELLEAILLGISSPNALTSRAITNLFFLAAKLMSEGGSSSWTEGILTSLKLLPKMQEENIVFYSERIGFAIGKLVIRCCEHARTEATWQTLMQLVHWTLQFPKFSREAFESILFAVNPFRYQQKAAIKLQQQQQHPSDSSSSVTFSRSFTFVTPINFSLILDNLVAFGRLPSCPVEVALETLEMFQLLISALPGLLGLHVPTSVQLTASGSIPQELLRLDPGAEQVALERFITPLFAALCERTKDARVLVRHHAMSHLQKGLLAPEMALCTSPSWLQIFDKIIFPLLVELLQPVTHDTPRDVVEETRLRASSLLCKTFLHYMSRIDVSSFHMLWLKVLSFVEMYMKADNSELLSEAVTESLKNILLVMFASGLLAKPLSSPDGTPDPQGSTLWDLSWKTIDAFSPSLRKEFMLKVYPSQEPPQDPARAEPVPAPEDHTE